MGEGGFDRTALIFEAGRAIRPYLRELVGENAARLDDELAEILNREDPDGADMAILDVLDELQQTHDWVSAFYRAGGIPPEVVKAVKPDADIAEAEHRVRIAMLGGGAPAGDPVLTIPGRRYACPIDGNEVWYRMDAAEEVRLCGKHNVPLQPAPLDIAKR